MVVGRERVVEKGRWWGLDCVEQVGVLIVGRRSVRVACQEGARKSR